MQINLQLWYGSKKYNLSLLVAFLSALQPGEAFLEVVSTEERYPDRTAEFGPLFPPAGQPGFLIPVEFLSHGNTHGCEPIDESVLRESPVFRVIRKNYAETLKSARKDRSILSQGTHDGDNDDVLDEDDIPVPWIAMVERGECGFAEKVRAMQKSGAVAVLVGDDRPGGLIRMSTKGRAADITIPSAFIMQWEYRDLKYQAMERLASALDSDKYGHKSDFDRLHPIVGMVRHFQSSGNPANNSSRERHPLDSVPSLAIRIYPDEFIDWPLLDVVLVTLLGPVMIILALYLLYRCRVDDGDFADPFASRDPKDTPAPSYVVDNLPKKVFSHELMGVNDPDICAICLDDFEEGDQLRKLPCKHEFHITCIDPWLLTRKRGCPICKGDTCPNEPANYSTYDFPLFSNAVSGIPPIISSGSSSTFRSSLLSIEDDGEDAHGVEPARVSHNTPTPDNDHTDHRQATLPNPSNNESSPLLSSPMRSPLGILRDGTPISAFADDPDYREAQALASSFKSARSNLSLNR